MNLLSAASEYLEVVGRSPAADGEGDPVLEHVDDQVEVDRLLPVHVRVPDWQFPGVSPEHLHLTLVTGGQELGGHHLGGRGEGEVVFV